MVGFDCMPLNGSTRKPWTILCQCWVLPSNAQHKMTVLSSSRTLHFLPLFLLPIGNAITFSISNRCSSTIWPAAVPGEPPGIVLCLCGWGSQSAHFRMLICTCLTQTGSWGVPNLRSAEVKKVHLIGSFFHCQIILALICSFNRSMLWSSFFRVNTFTNDTYKTQLSLTFS